MSKTEAEKQQEAIIAREKNFADQYDGFLKEFPEEALKAVPANGMTLTSVSAQYIVERLNEVLGIGGWRHQGAYEYKEVDGSIVVIFDGELVLTGGAVRRAAGASVVKSAKDFGNALKGAQTDSLSKCASKFGVANEVFKGNVAPPGKKTGPKVAVAGGRRDF